MTLQDIRNTPIRLSTLSSVFPRSKDLAGKAKRMEDAGELIRLKRGMYVVSPHISHTRISEYLIANHLYGPSYISMHSALRYYGMIPETVHETISVTSGIAHRYVNPIGTFRYIHAAPSYYPIGITLEQDENSTFLIASPEKALCDTLVFLPNLNLRYRKELIEYLENDLRLDMVSLSHLDTSIIRDCTTVARKKQILNHLINIISHEQHI